MTRRSTRVRASGAMPAVAADGRIPRTTSAAKSAQTRPARPSKDAWVPSANTSLPHHHPKNAAAPQAAGTTHAESAVARNENPRDANAPPEKEMPTRRSPMSEPPRA